MRKSPKTARKWKTADELEAMLAAGFGVPLAGIVVRGTPPDWTATLITNRAGNAERLAAFNRLRDDLRRQYDLKA